MISRDPTHRVRYSGIAKNQFAVFMESIAFNLKRMAVLTTKPYYLS